MRHTLEILKRAIATFAKHWKALIGTLLATVGGIALALLFRKFPTLRLPAGLTVTGIFLILLLWAFPKWQVRAIAGLDSKDRFDSENEARKTLSQILGGLVLLIGFYFTWQNLRTTQESLRVASEGQITDRFTKAIAQVGDEKLEVRLGGIYALERIAKDSPKDHWPIMEVLTAYVREHAVHTPQVRLSPGEPPLPRPKPAADIQAILTVIGRRTMIDQENRPLDLRRTNLSVAYLSNADLKGAFLISADLQEAYLIHTDLRGAYLRGANLTVADLDGADLRGADLADAKLQDATLRGADLRGADLTETIGLTTAQLEEAKGDAQTQLPDGIPRPKSWQ